MHPISVGTARANAQVERSILLAITNLLSVSQYLHTQSVKQLTGKVQLVINSTVHRITGYSPLELVTGRRGHIPGMLRLESEINDPQHLDLEEARDVANRRIDESAAYEMDRFAKRANPVIPFQVND